MAPARHLPLTLLAPALVALAGCRGIGAGPDVAISLAKTRWAPGQAIERQLKGLEPCWYKITVDKAQLLVLDGTKSGVDCYFSLHLSKKDDYAVLARGGARSKARIESRVIPGTYYLRVISKKKEGLVRCDFLQPDTLELGLLDRLDLTESGTRWFAMDLPSTGPYTFDVPSASDRLELRTFDRVLRTTHESGEDHPRRLNAELPRGKAYLRVRGASSDSSKPLYVQPGRITNVGASARAESQTFLLALEKPSLIRYEIEEGLEALELSLSGSFDALPTMRLTFGESGMSTTLLAESVREQSDKGESSEAWISLPKPKAGQYYLEVFGAAEASSSPVVVRTRYRRTPVATLPLVMEQELKVDAGDDHTIWHSLSLKEFDTVAIDSSWSGDKAASNVQIAVYDGNGQLSNWATSRLEAPLSPGEYQIRLTTDNNVGGMYETKVSLPDTVLVAPEAWTVQTGSTALRTLHRSLNIDKVQTFALPGMQAGDQLSVLLEDVQGQGQVLLRANARPLSLMADVMVLTLEDGKSQEMLAEASTLGSESGTYYLMLRNLGDTPLTASLTLKVTR